MVAPKGRSLMSGDENDDEWPCDWTSEAIHDAGLRVRVDGRAALSKLDDVGYAWRLGTTEIHKLDPGYVAGWASTLTDACRFRKQGFDFPELDRAGWAVIFRVAEPKP